MKILFLGDSIMNGQNVNLSNSYVSRISLFYSKNSDSNILVENISVNGKTTREALIDFPKDVQSSGADILLIQFGLNDLNHWATDKGLPRVNMNSFRYNLEEMVDRARAFGIQKVFLVSNHPIRKIVDINKAMINLEEFNQKYNAVIEDTARVKGTYFIDMHTILSQLNEAEYLQVDGVHPSNRGNQFYYDEVLNRLNRLFKELTD